MPDITNPVTFQTNEAAIIISKKTDPAFTHRDWSSDELESLRSAIRNHYRNEQRGICAYCRNPVSLYSALNCHVEHICPKSKRLDFIFEPKNLCVICDDCNSIKRAQETEANEPDTILNSNGRKIYPRSSNAFLIVHPHFDNWDEHIVQFGKIYLDITPKGNFTIGACILNRFLHKFGWEAVFSDENTLTQIMQSYINSTDSTEKSIYLRKLRELLVTV